MAEMYYNPAEDVFDGRVGRKLVDTGKIPRPYSHYLQQLRPGELMYVGIRGGHTPPQLVAWAYDEATYETFYQRYSSGAYMQFDV